MFGAIGGMFKGLTGAFRGPKSLGSPDKQQSVEEASEDEAEETAYRSEIVRRNQLRTSSTAGTGADFIRKMQQGPAGLDTPVMLDFDKPEKDTGPKYTDTELAQRKNWEAQLKKLRESSGGYSKGELGKANAKKRRIRIAELQSYLGQKPTSPLAKR